MEWEKLVLGAWRGFLKPLLQDLVKKTDNRWDDAAVEGIDSILERVLGDEQPALEDA